jgi:hypothetical protein
MYGLASAAAVLPTATASVSKKRSIFDIAHVDAISNLANLNGLG